MTNNGSTNNGSTNSNGTVYANKSPINTRKSSKPNKKPNTRNHGNDNVIDLSGNKVKKGRILKRENFTVNLG